MRAHRRLSRLALLLIPTLGVALAPAPTRAQAPTPATYVHDELHARCLVLDDDESRTPGFDAYTVQTHDGRSLFGRMESEAPNSLTLRDAGGQQHTVLRADVARLAAGAGSLMPGGFGQAMSAQGLADLVAYLKSAPR